MPDMTFEPGKNECTVTWAARDFSDEESPDVGTDEKFTARFKTTDIARRFLRDARAAVSAAALYKSPGKPAGGAAAAGTPVAGLSRFAIVRVNFR